MPGPTPKALQFTGRTEMEGSQQAHHSLQIEEGAGVVLSWKVLNATEVRIEPDVGTVAASLRSTTVFPAQPGADYTLKALRDDGKESAPDRKSTRLNSSHSQISYA